jgi:hypothetical protein
MKMPETLISTTKKNFKPFEPKYLVIKENKISKEL